MHLSQLILDPRARQVQRDLANRYELHRTLMRAFPAALPADERVLYRLEVEGRGAKISLLVQSLGQPDWSFVPAEYTLHPPACKPYQLNLTAGQALRFRLMANPTRKIKAIDTDSGPRPKRVGLLKEEEQLAWLKRKASDCGFSLLDLRTASQADVVAYATQGEGRKKLTFQAVQFDGILTVVDASRLTTAVHNGIGSAKGFGFGLLSLAPV